MYEVEDDKVYCYPGTTVLKNKLDLKDAADLAAFEVEISSQRATEPLPAGALDVGHYKAIHHHLFQDVYEWAGEVRSIRIGKGGNWFCFPEHIEGQLNALFDWLADKDYLRGLDAPEFGVQAAHFLAEINAVHPFREGNGRTQLSFLVLLAEQAGHPLDMEKLDPEELLNAIIESFDSPEGPLAEVIVGLL
jgi:cell filamentation protein